MRSYNRYTGPEAVPVQVGETHVTLHNDSGKVRCAAILEKRTSAEGTVSSILLDRVIHERHTKYRGWEAHGCFVTELSRKA